MTRKQFIGRMAVWGTIQLIYYNIIILFISILLYQKCRCFSSSVLYLYTHHKTVSRRFLWVLCEILAIYGSFNVMRDSWIRYNTNPTVITVQKDYRFWYLQFPSSTFCYVDPVDTEFAKDYVQRWVDIILCSENLIFIEFAIFFYLANGK